MIRFECERCKGTGIMPHSPDTAIEYLPRCGACNQLLCEECWHGDIGPGGEINRCQDCVMKGRLKIDVSDATGCPRFESEDLVRFGNGPVKKHTE